MNEHWEKVCREKAETEVSWFQERPQTSIDLIGRAGAVGDSKIVDVGAGASRLVDALLEEGYENLTVLDIAEAALKTTRERLGKARAEYVRFRACDIREWRPEEPFDLWHDRAVFHFMVTEEDRRSYLATLSRALRVRGQAIIATFAEAGPERCSGLPVHRYDPIPLADELGASYRLCESVYEDHRTPSGTTQRFQFSRFERVS